MALVVAKELSPDQDGARRFAFGTKTFEAPNPEAAEKLNEAIKASNQGHQVRFQRLLREAKELGAEELKALPSAADAANRNTTLLAELRENKTAAGARQ